MRKCRAVGQLARLRSTSMKTGNNLVLPTGNSALKDWLQIRDRNDSERRSRIDDAPDRLTMPVYRTYWNIGFLFARCDIG